MGAGTVATIASPMLYAPEKRRAIKAELAKG